jgi:hypothetical protein
VTDHVARYSMPSTVSGPQPYETIFGSCLLREMSLLPSPRVQRAIYGVLGFNCTRPVKPLEVYPMGCKVKQHRGGRVLVLFGVPWFLFLTSSSCIAFPGPHRPQHLFPLLIVGERLQYTPLKKSQTTSRLSIVLYTTVSYVQNRYTDSESAPNQCSKEATGNNLQLEVYLQCRGWNE